MFEPAPARIGGVGWGAGRTGSSCPLHSARHLRQPVRLRVVEEQRKLGVVHLHASGKGLRLPGLALHMYLRRRRRNVWTCC